MGVCSKDKQNSAGILLSSMDTTKYNYNEQHVSWQTMAQFMNISRCTHTNASEEDYKNKTIEKK